jgi:hypothetical protein
MDDCTEKYLKSSDSVKQENLVIDYTIRCFRKNIKIFLILKYFIYICINKFTYLKI